VIDDLDRMLRRLFRDRIPVLANDLLVRFEPPNADWQSYVRNRPGGTLSLNICLADLREDRELRSNERFRTSTNGYELEEAASARVECHYLISAWDQARATEAIQPTPDEHALLYDVLAVLFNNMPLNPSRVLSGAELAATDPLIRNSDLPTQVVPPEGFPKLAEFWSGMGLGIPWRPVVYVVVTLPVAFRSVRVGELVTTLITEYGVNGGDPDEVWIQIAGRVLDNAGAAVEDAWVRLETLAGARMQTTQTNELGRFTFVGLSADRYRLRFRAPGLAPQARVVDVPESSGEYDLRFP
jgi:hypothetical protein